VLGDRKCKSRSPSECTDASQWRCNNWGCGTIALEKLTWYREKTRTNSPTVLLRTYSAYRMNVMAQRGYVVFNNQRSSSYFITVSCFHTSTNEQHTCFQTIIHFGSSFMNCFIIMLQMISFSTILQGETKRVLRLRAPSSSTILMNVGLKSVSASTRRMLRSES